MTAIKKKGVLVVKLRCFAAVLRPDILKNPALIICYYEAGYSKYQILCPKEGNSGALA